MATQIKIPFVDKIIELKLKYELRIEYIMLTFIAGLILGLLLK